MKNKMKFLAVIVLSQALSTMSLKAGRLLEPLEVTSETSRLQTVKEFKSEDLSTKLQLSKETLEDHNASSYNNIKSALFYGAKVLSGIGSSMIYGKYLSHYTMPGIFTNVPRFGAALLGYTLPDMLDSATGFSQKSNTSSEPFSTILKNSFISAGTYMGNYMMTLTADAAFAQIAYHGTLYLTANPLLANASYQAARDLTYFTGSTTTLTKAIKEVASTILLNAKNSAKKWWFGKAA